MATEKVGIYRKYHGPIPTDKSGKPLPKSEWPKKRLHRWAIRWYGSDGKRYSKSFKARKEAERLAEEKQSEVRDGKADQPGDVSLKEFAKMYLDIRSDLAMKTHREHSRMDSPWSWPTAKPIRSGPPPGKQSMRRGHHTKIHRHCTR